MSVVESLLMGAEIMLLGMGTVFAFLIVLVFTLKGMSAIAQRLGEAQPAESTQAASAAPNTQDIDSDHDPRLVAVISAAIARYRTSHGEEAGAKLLS